MNMIALNLHEVEELNHNELEVVEGGLWGEILTALVVSAIENWGDIRHGFNDGMSGGGPRP